MSAPVKSTSEERSAPTRETTRLRSLCFLRKTALIALPAGAVGAIAFMLRAGHRNPFRVLLLLFAVCVLSPFVALVFAIIVSKDWSAITRATLHGVILVLTLTSLAFYGAIAFGPPRAKTAFTFVQCCMRKVQCSSPDLP